MAEYGSVNVQALRVTPLTAAGAPDVGSNAVVTQSTLTIDYDLDIEEGEEITVKNAAGLICLSKQGEDSIKRADVDLTLCQLDFELLELMAGGTLHLDMTTPVGYSVKKSDAALQNPVCVEGWSLAWDGTTQAVDGMQNPLYLHWVFPLCRFVPGAGTLEEGAFEIPLSGTSDENGLLTTNGPFDDWPSNIVGENIDAAVNVFLDTAVPSVFGTIAVPAQA